MSTVKIGKYDVDISQAKRGYCAVLAYKGVVVTATGTTEQMCINRMKEAVEYWGWAMGNESGESGEGEGEGEAGKGE